MIDTNLVAGVLGVKASSISDLAYAVERGLPKEALRRTTRRVFTERGAAARFAVKVVPEATFKRRVRLTQEESERTERLARVIAGAEYVWGDQEQAREWLNTPHPELENRPPVHVALSELGARRVETLLDGIFYGLPA
jgi:putative toxin-antitoxin system antitoxin component (TIGR02293 family)